MVQNKEARFYGPWCIYIPNIIYSISVLTLFTEQQEGTYKASSKRRLFKQKLSMCAA